MAKLNEPESIAQMGQVLSGIDYGPEVEGKCNARIASPVNRTGPRTPRRCKMDAGFGTDHPGFGKCKHHYGNTPAVRRGALKEMYVAEFAETLRFGQPRAVDPMSGILEEIARSNGFIAFLERKITNRETAAGDVPITYVDEGGTQHVEAAVELWKAERTHFARCCKMAVDMGVAKAQIELAVLIGGKLAELLETVLRDLGHDPDDPQVNQVVDRRLVLLTSDSEQELPA